MVAMSRVPVVQGRSIKNVADDCARSILVTAMELNFDCTICGKCCYGQIPLTIEDAITYADRFPLAITWTPVGVENKYFEHTTRLGSLISLTKRKNIGVRITPTAYIPPSLPCPELAEDNKCNIHDNKPSRCRTMPFSPYRNETHQADLLIPREGWECDTSAEAPVVYRDGKIIKRQDFETEFDALLGQSDHLRRYADWLLDSAPALMRELKRTAKQKGGGQVIVSFFSLLPHLPDVDVKDFATKQLPIINEYIEKTSKVSALKIYHKHYKEYALGLEKAVKN